jgi:hypothetical protein
MNEENFKEAKESVEKLLDLLEVKRVVSVDDINGEDISLPDVIAAANSMEDSILLQAFPEIGESISCDQEIRADQIRRTWEQLVPTSRMERGKALVIAARMHDTDNEANDVADISILSDLIQENKLTCLSPGQWEEQKEQLLQESVNQRTLFLFDQDFSKAGGSREEGINIIANLLNGDTNNLICGLLTHTVSPEEQQQQWRHLSNAHNIPLDRFILIPKLYLSKDPILFALTLKFTVLIPDFTELKQRTKKIIEDAAATAAKQVEEISIYDLDHIVFQVPSKTKEGLWEPDMLFRLYAMFHRREFCRLAYDGGELETIAARLRTVSAIPTTCDGLSIPSSAWELQRKELYEDSDYINKNHLPLELGDIFERVGGASKKKYILLAQPCDLMVRPGGKRHHGFQRIPLAEFAPLEETPSDKDKDKDKKPSLREEMPYFDSSPKKKWFVNFKCIHFVRGCLLDLCVFNQDGVARLTVGGNAPSGIRPAWKKCHKKLSTYWKNIANKSEMFAPENGEHHDVTQFKERIARDMGLVNLFLNDDLFKGKLTKDGDTRLITFDCKRVKRLSRDRAIGMLMSYTATLVRPAYDLSFVDAPVDPVEHDI